MATLLYLLVVLLPSIQAQCDIKHASPFFSRAVSEFSNGLMNRLSQVTENHFVTSPLSLWTIISTISLGAEDQTLSEIKQVLRLHPHKCFNNRFFEIVHGITNTSDETILERSSTAFVDRSLLVHEEFQRKLAATGVCDMMILPFDNFVTVSTTINDYISRVTHNTIQEIVTPADLESVYLILIDAIYFKGKWQIPFDPSETELTTFYDESNNPAGDVNMMYKMGKFNAAPFDQIQAKVLELPYGNGERFSMLVFLPYTDVRISTVIELLDTVSLRSIFYIFKRFTRETVHVELPRFKITSDLDNLKELLIDMGLQTMFDRNAAQFTQISDYNLYISNVLQKADIEVTEEGTLATAASEAEFESRTLPDQFIVNKPFLYMIVDKSTYVPLFAGAYSKPSSF